jgi:A/G-specific adenine glycosylase
VARVLPAYEAWLARWPTPPALAADAPADAVRQWGRLGYPRRALRLSRRVIRQNMRLGVNRTSGKHAVDGVNGQSVRTADKTCTDQSYPDLALHWKISSP